MANSPLVALLPGLEEPIAHLTKGQSQDESWTKVQVVAKSIADGLRTKDGTVDNHTQLGASSLPQHLSKLVKLSVSEAQPTPRGPAADAVYELLRVGANLCMDHDGNRQRLLDAGYTLSVHALLQEYLKGATQTPPHVMSLSDLKIIKTAIGALLNASIGFENTKTALVAASAPLTILNLSLILYSPTQWASLLASGQGKAGLEEWEWKSGLSNWAWRAIEVLTRPNESEQEEQERPTGVIFGREALPTLVKAFAGFIPPLPAAIPPIFSSSASSFIKADIDTLEEVSMMLESLALDSNDVRLALAQSATEGSNSALGLILEFVENGSPLPYWSVVEDTEAKERWGKTLALCKAAVIKAVVTVAGDEANLEFLWRNDAAASGGYPGGWLVERMGQWIKNFSKSPKSPRSRDDLAICGTLVLGNLARKESHCKAIVQPPLSLVPDLLPLLHPDMDIKIKHGAIGLLKHLSQSQSNKSALGESGILEALTASKIWGQSGDMAEVVQVSAIGTAKHLCTSNSENAQRLVLGRGNTTSASNESNSAESDTGIDQITDLVKRSDSIVLQSEGTRVLVNVIKSLWSSGTNSSGSESGGQARRREAIDKVTNLDSAELLVEMLARSAKYPILLNEAVVALTLLSNYPSGAPPVLQSLVAVSPFNPSSEAKTPSNTAQPPATVVDVLKLILNGQDKAFPPELRANVCSLLMAVGKISSSAEGGSDASKIRSSLLPTLQAIVSSTDDQSTPKIVKTSAQKALDVLSSVN